MKGNDEYSFKHLFVDSLFIFVIQFIGILKITFSFSLSLAIGT